MTNPTIDKLSSIGAVITAVKLGHIPVLEAQAAIQKLVDEAVVAGRIDELNHIQLEYGGRFIATTYIDGDGQTITARIADLTKENGEE